MRSGGGSKTVHKARRWRPGSHKSLQAGREEAQLGRLLVPGWDQVAMNWRGLGRAGWAAILRVLPAWGRLHEVYLPPPERPWGV